MREIKFRAWDKTNKRMMIFGRFWACDEYQSLAWGIDDESKTETEGNYCLEWESSTLEIMQYTGLKDKNGNDIYEGDILRNTRYIQDVEIYWNGCTTDENSINGPSWIKWGGWHFKKLENDDRMTYATYQDEIEIIGNIYENPKLLEK